jgi:hypothetical protein
VAHPGAFEPALSTPGLGMIVGLAMVIPAAAIALAVLLRHPRAAGRRPTAASPTGVALR